MARFAVGQMIETREPIIEVDPGMEPGRHRFQLVVVNEADVRSVPATAIIEIKRSVEEPRVPAPPSLGIAAPAPPRAAPATPRAAPPKKRTAPPKKRAAPPEKRTAKPQKKKTTTKPGPKKK